MAVLLLSTYSQWLTKKAKLKLNFPFFFKPGFKRRRTSTSSSRGCSGRFWWHNLDLDKLKCISHVVDSCCSQNYLIDILFPWDSSLTLLIRTTYDLLDHLFAIEALFYMSLSCTYKIKLLNLRNSLNSTGQPFKNILFLDFFIFCLFCGWYFPSTFRRSSELC